MINTIKQNPGKTAGGVSLSALVMATALIVPWEGKRNDPYYDIVKVPTDCYGHTGPDVVMGQRRTDAECLARLNDDLREHSEPIVACVPQIKDKPYQLGASISLAFNIGVKAYCGSSVAAQFRAGNDAAGCANFDKWVYAKGKRIQGLANRRAAERKLCEKGLS
jgi:lysozyme